MEHQLYNEIAANIRLARKARGLTLEELAHRADIAPSYLGQLERAERKPSIHTVAVIAECLGMASSGLFFGWKSAPKASDDSDGQLAALLRGASKESRRAAFLTVKLVLRLFRQLSDKRPAF